MRVADEDLQHRAAARDARAPVGHNTTRGKALFFGRSPDDSSLPSGTFLAPAAWPAAYSAGSLTSISWAFSRLISITASLVDTLPPPTPRCSVGHSSKPPDARAAR